MIRVARPLVPSVSWPCRAVAVLACPTDPFETAIGYERRRELAPMPAWHGGPPLARPNGADCVVLVGVQPHV